jgi:hypothetical protein
MNRWKRLFYYLLINVIVSACTVWTVLSIWQMTHQNSAFPINPFVFDLSSATKPPVLETLAAGPPLQTTATNTLQPGNPISPTMQTAPVSGTNPISTQALSLGSLVAITNVFGMGDLATEKVRLEPQGQTGVSLSGWKLTDGRGHTYTFPDLTLYPGGTVDVHSGPGSDDVVSLYWGLDQPIWATGRTVKLLNGQGSIQATFVIP